MLSEALINKNITSAIKRLNKATVNEDEVYGYIKDRNKKNVVYHSRQITKPNGGYRTIYFTHDQNEKIAQKVVLRTIAAPIDSSLKGFVHAYRENHSAITLLNQLIAMSEKGYVYIGRADIKRFFDNIDHEILLTAVNNKLKDPQLNNYIDCLLGTPYLHDGRVIPVNDIGLLQGFILAPLLSNVFADAVIDTPWCKSMDNNNVVLLRYCDDLIIMGKSRRACERGVRFIIHKLKEVNLKLKDYPKPLSLEERELLCFGFWVKISGSKIRQIPAPNVLARFNSKLEEKFNSPEQVKQYVSGFVNYYCQNGESADIIMTMLNRHGHLEEILGYSPTKLIRMEKHNPFNIYSCVNKL